MIPSSFEYARATSIEDAIAKLASSGGSAKLIAGGHSLVPLMKLRLSEPSSLIDISRIAELAGIRQDGDAIHVGAGTTHRDIAASTLLREQCPMLAEAAADVGDPQVRNKGTLGGSLAHADPAADYPAVVLALDAAIHVQGPTGRRTVPASAFFQDLFTVDLAPDELIVGIGFAPVRAAAYVKLPQRASRYAIVGVAVALETSGGTISSARVGVTGAGPKAFRLTSLEGALAGRPLADAVSAVNIADDDVQELNSEIHASAEYRRAMIDVYARRAVQAAVARAGA